MVYATSQQEFSDADWRAVATGDQSKKVALDVSGVTTATTRTLTVPNASGTIALTSDLSAYQPLDADLTSWAAITRASGFDTFVATPSSANLAALLTDESGTAGTVPFQQTGNYTPTVTPSSGAITSYTSAGSYVKIGNLVVAVALITITNNGTGSGYQQISLPFTPATNGAAAAADASTGAVLIGFVIGSSPQVNLRTATAGYPGLNSVITAVFRV